MSRPPRPDCPCAFRWGAFGLLYGISMGHGWIRTSTDPDCPEHGDAAERARAGRVRAKLDAGTIDS